MVPIISVVGRSDVGKTTLLEKLLPEFKKRGYRVGTIKHDVHGFDLDKPGKDSWRMARAGSDMVAISSPDRVAVIRKVEEEWTADRIVHHFGADLDIILTEGYKRGGAPKVEVYRKEKGGDLLCSPEELVAIVTDERFPINVPHFHWDDTEGLVDLLEERFITHEDDSNGVSLWIDGKPISLKPFVMDFIANTVKGMVVTLKGIKTPGIIYLHIKKRLHV
ncbi:MAG: molybdopterin-guanine dinucleotide biosynthesis protein B [Chloroflexi bacterium]|nr:molybdopterin-guanine dinucleotide biosynthesis protein B [Chloroflexota bacterium]